MGLFLIAIYLINIGTTTWYNGENCVEATPWNFLRIFIPGALLLELYIEKLKSEPLRIYESRFKVGQKIKYIERIPRSFGSPMYYDPFSPFYRRSDILEIKKVLKIQMIDKLNRIYYTDDGKYDFSKLEIYGQALKSTWIVKQRKGPKRERR